MIAPRCSAILCLLLAAACRSQTTTAGVDSEDVNAATPPATLVSELKEGRVDHQLLFFIIKSHVYQAVPILQDRFASMTDGKSKEEVASTLLALGVKSENVKDYLIARATTAISSDEPFPTNFDENGKLESHTSQEFKDWATQHHLTEEQALEEDWQGMASVQALADVRDPRSIPLFRQALFSHHYIMAAIAAEALADMNDVESIPLIMSVCKGAPAELAQSVARDSLLKFKDEEANRAAARYIPRDFLDQLLKEKEDAHHSSAVERQHQP